MGDATPAEPAQQAPGAGGPMVSICIPTFNGASWIRDAIGSALAQAPDLCEVVVSDDGSEDDTLAIARSLDNPRLRVIANEPRVGMARNWNRAVNASWGVYIKLLMQDDLLEPDCVSRMLEAAGDRPEVGLVFCPRTIHLDDPDDISAQRWRNRYGVLHGRLGRLKTVNDGRTIFAAMWRDRFRGNWIGEPTAVMVRRDAFAQVGLFNLQLPQATDLEMWLRIAYFYDVAFVDTPLVTIRFHVRSASSVNDRLGLSWLDRIWLLEGLRVHPEIRRELASWGGRRIWFFTCAAATKRLVRIAMSRRGATRTCLGQLGDYLRFRLGRRRGRVLHEPLSLDIHTDRGQ